MATKHEHYLKAKDLVTEIILSKAQDKLTKKAENMLILLGKKTIRKMRYQNDDDRNDCFQTGMMVVFMAWRNFNPERSNNAFAYFTEVFKRGIARGWGELHYHKGDDDRTSKTYSLNTGNDGEAMFGF